MVRTAERPPPGARPIAPLPRRGTDADKRALDDKRRRPALLGAIEGRAYRRITAGRLEATLANTPARGGNPPPGQLAAVLPARPPAAAGAHSRDGGCTGWLLAIQAADATGEAGKMNASNRRVRQRRGVRRQRLVRWRRCHHAATDGEYKRGCTAGQRECGPSSHFHFVFSSGFTFSFADQLSTVVLSDPRRTQKLPRSGPAYSRSAYPRVGSIACSCGRHLTWRGKCGSVT